MKLHEQVDELKLIVIETLIENNQHYITQEIAYILIISKSIKLLVTMKNVCFILWKKNIQTFWPTQYHSQIDSQFGGLGEGYLRVSIALQWTRHAF